MFKVPRSQNGSMCYTLKNKTLKHKMAIGRMLQPKLP